MRMAPPSHMKQITNPKLSHTSLAVLQVQLRKDAHAKRALAVKNARTTKVLTALTMTLAASIVAVHATPQNALASPESSALVATGAFTNAASNLLAPHLSVTLVFTITPPNF